MGLCEILVFYLLVAVATYVVFAHYDPLILTYFVFCRLVVIFAGQIGKLWVDYCMLGGNIITGDDS